MTPHVASRIRNKLTPRIHDDATCGVKNEEKLTPRIHDDTASGVKVEN